MKKELSRQDIEKLISKGYRCDIKGNKVYLLRPGLSGGMFKSKKDKGLLKDLGIGKSEAADYENELETFWAEWVNRVSSSSRILSGGLLCFK